MGDDGKLYVSEELVEIYKKEVIPGANFIKPNQTECEYVIVSAALASASLSPFITTVINIIIVESLPPSASASLPP